MYNFLVNKVLIDNTTTKRFAYKKSFEQILEIATRLTKVKGDNEVNLIIVDNEAIRKLCIEYKKIDKVTDVLSFPADWKELSKLINKNLLGDIVICFEKLEKQAKEYGHSEKREWHYLFAHGVIHLLGYDHLNEADEKKMNSLVDKIMEEIKVNR